MKILLSILTLSLLLNASMFTKEERNSPSLIEEFRQNVSDTNSIIYKGEYEKIASSKASVLSLMKKVDNLEIPQQKKEKLKTDLQSYLEIVETVTKNLQKDAPELKKHHDNSFANLDRFNKKISSIGLYALSSRWKELSAIKNSFVKKPSNALEKKFDNIYNEVVVTITELYLDEEIESFLLGYLENYQLYFQELRVAYQKTNHEKMSQLRPLSYKIKAEFELL